LEPMLPLGLPQRNETAYDIREEVVERIYGHLKLPTAQPGPDESAPLNGGSTSTAPDANPSSARGVAYVVGTKCPHVECWKRLRAKKGIAHYVCRLCNKKWRTISSKVLNLSNFNAVDVLPNPTLDAIFNPAFSYQGDVGACQDGESNELIPLTLLGSPAGTSTLFNR
jgi:hypothetical protein